MAGDDSHMTARVIRIIVLVGGVVAAVIALVAVTIYARRELRKALLVTILLSHA